MLLHRAELVEFHEIHRRGRHQERQEIRPHILVGNADAYQVVADDVLVREYPRGVGDFADRAGTGNEDVPLLHAQHSDAFLLFVGGARHVKPFDGHSSLLQRSVGGEIRCQIRRVAWVFDDEAS